MNIVKAVHLNINKTWTHNLVFSSSSMFFHSDDKSIVCHNYSTCTMKDISVEKLTAGDLVWHDENVVGFLVVRSLGRCRQTNVREAHCG
jgi:hypothetical protein